MTDAPQTPPPNGNGTVVAEKSHLQSKKFVAYLIAELTWKGIIALLIFKWTEGWAMGIMLTIVIVAGFIECGYILGQAALDRYTRVAEITMNAQKHLSVNGKGPDLGIGKDDGKGAPKEGANEDG